MEIITEHLILREFLFNDFPVVLAYQQSHKYLEFYRFSTLIGSDTEEFVQWYLDEQTESPRNRVQLAVVLKETSNFIGNAGVHRKPENDWGADLDL